MDELDLPHLLDEDAPEAGPDALARIVRRHGLRRLRRARIAASTAVLVALAGAGVGIGLTSSPRPTVAGSGVATRSSREGGQPPPGLTWERQSGGARAETPAPGVFGWLGGPSYSSSAPDASAAAAGARQASPPAATYGSATARVLPTVCTKRGCGVVYGGESPVPLFERTVDGVTIEADLSRYAFPMGEVSPEVPGAGTSGGTPTASGSSTHAGPPSSSHFVRVALPCLSPSELIVTVSRGGMSATLAVPGSASGRTFSVAASAGAELAGDDVVVAIAQTSPAVRTVTSRFAGGGGDRMAPVDGWSVLAHRTHGGEDFAAGAVTLLARSATGATLEQVRLPGTGSLAMASPGTCLYSVGKSRSSTTPTPASTSEPAAGAPATSG